jgi:hypothetical protein
MPCVGMMLGAILAAVLITPIATADDHAQSDEVSGFVGEWRGDSTCVAKNTACHDETVVYRIARLPEKPGYVAVSADKIVSGKAVNMGTLEFRYDHDQHMLVCEYSHGLWRLKAGDGKMEGTLTAPDNTVFRRVTLRKKP